MRPAADQAFEFSIDSDEREPDAFYHDARASAEAILSDADKAAKSADATLSSAREDRARTQALSEAAQARIGELRDRIRDELETVPEELAERAEIEDDEELPPLEQPSSSTRAFGNGGACNPKSAAIVASRSGCD